MPVIESQLAQSLREIILKMKIKQYSTQLDAHAPLALAFVMHYAAHPSRFIRPWDQHGGAEFDTWIVLQ
jgi:hypothetical protein